MNEQTQQIIETIAEKLSVPAEMLWGAMLRQAPMDAALNLAGVLLIWLALVFYSWFWRRWWKQDEPEPIILVGLGWVLLAIGTLGFTMGHAGMIYAGFFNPEYWALMELVKR